MLREFDPSQAGISKYVVAHLTILLHDLGIPIVARKGDALIARLDRQEHRIPIGGLLRDCAARPEDADALLRRFAEAAAARLLGEQSAAEEWAVVREAIYPRLVAGSTAHAAGLPGQPFLANLQMVYAIEGEERTLVTEQLIAYWDIEAAALDQIAFANLEHWSAREPLTIVGDWPDGIVLSQTDTGLDAARVLLTPLLEALAGQAGGTLLVGIPHADTFVACGEGDPELGNEIARQVQQEHAAHPEPLCNRLLWFNGSGLVDR